MSGPSIRTIKPIDTLALAFILILAGGLRMGAPGITEFKNDEALLSRLALDLVHGREFPLLGIPSSVGIPNTPISVYLLALPYALSSDPILATVFMGWLNTLAVGALYGLAHRYYGRAAAFVAALLYAVGPWAVIYSRKIWAQDLLPIFVISAIGCGLLGFWEGKCWAQFLALPLLSVTVQIHYAALALLPVFVALIWNARAHLKRAVIPGLLIALALGIPFVVGLSRAGPLAVFGGTNPDRPNALAFSGEAFREMIQLVSGADLFNPALTPTQRAQSPDTNAFYLLGVVLVIAVGWRLVRLTQPGAHRVIDGVLLLWLLAVPLIFSISWTAMYPHYLIAVLPASFLLIGVLVNDVWVALAASRRLHFLMAGSLAILLVGFISAQAAYTVLLLRTVDTINTPGGFGTPLHFYETIRRAILDQHRSGVLAILNDPGVDYPAEVNIWTVALYDLSSVRFVDESAGVYPADPAIVLSRHCDSPQTVQRFDLRPGEGCYALSIRTKQDAPIAGFQAIDTPSFENDARLIAYRWQPKPNPCLSLAWTVEKPVPETPQVAVHLIDRAGKEIAFADGPLWIGPLWRAGDTLIEDYCVTSGREHLADVVGVRIGLYTRDGSNFHNLSRVNQDRSLTSEPIELSLKP